MNDADEHATAIPELDPEICRRARLSRDPRFDGEFFLAVKTTGIYCRPTCPARAPAEKNVRYYRNATQAAGAGYRPCLRCRPESAPGSPAWLGSSTTVRRALALISEGVLNDGSLGQLADRLGVGERYLRKLFQREMGVSPLAVAHNQRLLFARKLLAETHLPITEIAFAAGFGSVRRFNTSVREAFRTTPGELRRRHTRAGSGGEIHLFLQYRPPYDWEGVLDFYARHAIESLESVDDGAYTRQVLVNGEPAGFCIRPQRGRPALAMTVRLADQRQLMPLVARVRRMFDLDANPAVIADCLGGMPVMGDLLKRFPGVRSPLAWSPFESAVRAIVGQQVSIAAARTVCGKLLNATCVGRSPAAFPEAAAIAALDDSHFAMPGRRRETLRALCRQFSGREADLDPGSLGDIPGVGPWTTALVRMRGFGDPDVFPPGDLGLVRAFQDAESNSEPLPAEDWRPWRSYAANLLWRSLLA